MTFDERAAVCRVDSVPAGQVVRFEVQHRQAQLREASARHWRPA